MGLILKERIVKNNKIINLDKSNFILPLLGNGIVHSELGVVLFEVDGFGFMSSWSFRAFLISNGEKVFHVPKLGKERAQI